MGENSKNKLLEFAMAHEAGMVCTLDQEGRFIQVGDAFLQAMGYSWEALAGQPARDFIHPNDGSKIFRQVSELVNQSLRSLKLPAFRFKAAPGEWRWLEARVTNLLHEPEVGALIISFSDHTGQKQARLQQVRSKLAESELRFRSLFDNNPAMVVFEDESGTILDANAAFLAFIRKKEKEVIYRSFYDFLPPEEVPRWQQQQREAFSGKKVGFEADILFEQLGMRMLSVSKVPLIVDQEVVAVHTVLQDLTAAITRHRVITRQDYTFNTIFETITETFFILDRAWNFIYLSPGFEKVTQIDRTKAIGKNIRDVYPEDAYQDFYPHYRYAIETGKPVHFETYYENLDKWLQVVALPTIEGLSVYFHDITGQVRTRQELEKLSLVASKIPNAVMILDAAGQVEWVNKSFTQLNGYTLAEVAGQAPDRFLEIGPLARKFRQAAGFREEALLASRSGEKRWYDLEVTPVFDEAGQLSKRIVIQSDITSRKEAEQQLQRLSLVASKTTHGVIITDAQGLTEWVNEGFTRLNGYACEEILGKKPGTLLQGPDTDPAQVQHIREKLRECVPFSATLLNYKKSGEPFWVNMDISPVFDDAGQISKFIAIQKDITLLKEAEDNLLKMSQELYQHNRDLQQFTYIISHNLRSPMANVLGLTDLLTGLHKESPDFDLALKHLKESIVRLDYVLKDINLVLSVRDKQGLLERENIRIKDMIGQALEGLQEPLAQSNGQVEVEVEDGLAVLANRAYLYSIFYNLLSNAIKYRSPERPLRIRIQATLNDKKEVFIHFSDNGLGIDLQKAGDNLFRMYKRFHAHIEGKGIGLFLVKEHVEAMGGRIEVTSQVGVGTSFFIRFGEDQGAQLHPAAQP